MKKTLDDLKAGRVTYEDAVKIDETKLSSQHRANAVTNDSHEYQDSGDDSSSFSDSN